MSAGCRYPVVCDLGTASDRNYCVVGHLDIAHIAVVYIEAHRKPIFDGPIAPVPYGYANGHNVVP